MTAAWFVVVMTCLIYRVDVDKEEIEEPPSIEPEELVDEDKPENVPFYDKEKIPMV